MRQFFVALLLCIEHTGVRAAGTVSRHEGEVPEGYNFILYEPERADSLMPLIITLHSRGAAGTDLGKVDCSGTIDALQSGVELDACVLAPQTPNDTWDPAKVMADVDWAQSRAHGQHHARFDFHRPCQRI